MRKIKSIAINEYFELVNPKYVFFKLIPHSSCKNNNSDKLAQLVNKMYLELNKRIYKEDKKIFLRLIVRLAITFISRKIK